MCEIGPCSITPDSPLLRSLVSLPLAAIAALGAMLMRAGTIAATLTARVCTAALEIANTRDTYRIKYRLELTPYGSVRMMLIRSFFCSRVLSSRLARITMGRYFCDHGCKPPDLDGGTSVGNFRYKMRL